ncbi:MAG: hypothetical protein H6719_14075 [Sandaracinaceae bacterium]|nr:hypothetical protein [Sandaracinaceae bacterium]
MSRITLVAAATALVGCSLLVDNSGFVGEGGVPSDGGTDDGGLDAGPDAPSMPAVHIEPAAPSPGDALDAVIDTDSVDPLAAGAITYEYRWLRDGTDASVTTSGVPADTIALGETWRVEVTPVTTDGRRGAPGAAMVTVGNTPPTLRTVGLSTYRPIQNDVLEALPGSATDPDGDVVRIAYAWFVDDSPIAAETSSRLTIRSDWSVGSRVRVEARAIDTSDAASPSVESAEAIVVADVPRWRQLLPDRNRVVATVRDTHNERVVLVVEQPDATNHLWEHDLVSNRFVRLRPPTPVEGRFTVLSYLTSDARIFRVSDDGTIPRIDVLDTTSRGAESWSSVELSSPLVGLMTGGTYDAASGRLYLAIEDQGTFTHDLVRIDISGPSATPEHLSDAISAPIKAGAWVFAEERDEILVFGGEGSDAIHRIDLSSTSPTLEELATRLPAVLSYGLGTYDAASGRYLIGFGGNATGGALLDAWWFDPDDGSFQPVDVSAAPPSLGRGWIGVDHAGELLYWPGGENPFSYPLYELYAIDRTTNASAGVHVVGVDLPPGSFGGFAGRTARGMVMHGGTDRDGVVLGATWRLPYPSDSPFRTIDRLEPMPDPSTGEPGARTTLSSSATSPAFVFGGRDESGELVAGALFRFDETTWEALTTSATSPAPAARTGASLFEGCDTLTLFGGEVAAGLSDEVWRLSCGATCTWSQATLGGTAPSARTEAAISPSGVLFGGRSSSGVRSDAFYLPGCSTDWRPATLSQPIGPRMGHGMTAFVLFGGYDGADYHAETYLIEDRAGTGMVDVTEIVPPGDGDGTPAGRSRMAIADDFTLSRVYVYGGYYGPRPPLGAEDRVFADLWELRPR